ncbi:BTB/POZ domain protein, partial [Ancylostoma duodenale]
EKCSIQPACHGVGVGEGSCDTSRRVTKRVFESLEQLRSDGHLCDVEFLVGNETISAHKIVLAASIPYFKAMFTTDMLEARKHRIRITIICPGFTGNDISDIDHTTLRDLILLMYGHDLTISRTNVQAIMVAANFLQKGIDGARSLRSIQCCFQIPHVTENCAVIIVDAIIEANFKLISRSEGLVELDVEEVVELLSKDELQVETEEQVFRAAMRWIEHSSSRTKHIAR